MNRWSRLEIGQDSLKDAEWLLIDISKRGGSGSRKILNHRRASAIETPKAIIPKPKCRRSKSSIWGCITRLSPPTPRIRLIGVR